MNNKFINEVTKHIKNKNAKQTIEAELSSHILDKIDYYIELGYTKEQAEEMATADMGDPEQTAVPLNSLHNIRWYKKKENFIALILNVVLFTAVCYLHTALLYDNSLLSLFSLIYSPVPNIRSHNLDMDLISIVIFIFTLVAVNLARKNHSKFIAVTTAVSVFFQIVFPPYQPMLYSAAKMIESGFSGYTDSIFLNSFIERDIEPFMSIGSFLIALVFLALCIYIFIGIFLQERGISHKSLWKPYKIIKAVLICFLTLNITFIAVSATVAYATIDEKIAEINEMKKREIEFVVNTPIINKGLEEIEKDLETAGFNSLVQTDYSPYVYQSDMESSYLTIYCEYDSDLLFLAFTTKGTSNLSPINDDCLIMEDEFDIFKEKMVFQEYDADDDDYSSMVSMLSSWSSSKKTPEMSLDNFMNGDLFQKAVFVDKTFHEPIYNENRNFYEDIRFSFNLKSDQYRSATMVFTDGYLTDLQFWYN